MKISNETSSVYVADHTVDAECGIGVYSSHNNVASYLPVDMVNTTLRVGGETAGVLTDTQDYVIDLGAFTTGHFKFSGSVEALYGEDFIAAARVDGTTGGPTYVDMTGSNLWDWDLPFGSGGVNVSQTGITGARSANGWAGVVKQQTDSRFGLADNTIASWREDQFAFENKISIGTIPDVDGNFSTPTFDAEIGLAHTSQKNVSDANSANPDTLASNIYSKACTVSGTLPAGAGEDTCGIGVSVLYNGRSADLGSPAYSGQIERLSMDGAGNTVLDMTNGSTGSAGDVVINNGGLTVDEDLVVGDGADALAGTVEIGGEIDQPQLVIEGFSTQSDSVLVVQNDADAQVFNVNNDGAVYAQSIGDIDTGAASNWNVTSAGQATFAGIEVAAAGAATLFQFDDTSFDGQTDYAPAAAAGTGSNVGETDRDGFYGINCDESDFAIGTNGCGFKISVGRRLGDPEFEIIDKTSFTNTSAADLNQILIDAPIVNRGAFGNGSINLAHGTIQGAVHVGQKAAATSSLQEIGLADQAGSWIFATGDGSGTINLKSPDSVGRNVCIYATVPGAGLNIQASPHCTDNFGGSYSEVAPPFGQTSGTSDGQCDSLSLKNTRVFSNFVISGTTYSSPTGQTGARIRSSGSAGDFVCLLSANPNSDVFFEWYVLAAIRNMDRRRRFVRRI